MATPANPETNGTRILGDDQGYVIPPHVKANTIAEVDDIIRIFPLETYMSPKELEYSIPTHTQSSLRIFSFIEL